MNSQLRFRASHTAVIFLLAFFPGPTDAVCQSLPEPLISLDGTAVETAEQWTSPGGRRDEVLKLFRQHMYGSSPPAVKFADIVRHHEPIDTMDGAARMLQETLYFNDDHAGPKIDLLIFLPPTIAGAGPYPAFLVPNFFGNHTIHNEPRIRDTHPYQWQRQGRGARAAKWDIKAIVSHGYALVTYAYGDIDPDDSSLRNGVHALFPHKDYQDRGDNWTAIGAWAWGASRVMDYLEDCDEVIDPHRVVLMGHSRLGKAALWAGANDERFAIVVSNDSGAGGASLSRDKGPGEETVAQLNGIFAGAWFAKNFQQYSNNENALPIDQHMLIALIAPRPVYIGNAREDVWADPDGSFLAARYATPVYGLFGLKGLAIDALPEDETASLDGRIGFHIREGRHSVTSYDWNEYLRFADRYLTARSD